jgi:hypothetical protein
MDLLDDRRFLILQIAEQVADERDKDIFNLLWAHEISWTWASVYGFATGSAAEESRAQPEPPDDPIGDSLRPGGEQRRETRRAVYSALVANDQSDRTPAQKRALAREFLVRLLDSATHPILERLNVLYPADPAGTPQPSRSKDTDTAGTIDEESGEEPENVFRQEGQKWLVRFQSEERTVPDPYRLKGMMYIRDLLASPHVAIAALVLKQRYEMQEAAQNADTALAEDAVRCGDLEVSDGSYQSATREEAESLRRQMDDLKTKYEAAVTAELWAKAEKLEEEREALRQDLASRFGLSGRPREEGSPAELARKAVCNAVDRAIEAIREDHARLADHLDSRIDRGVALTYRPSEPLQWQT